MVAASTSIRPKSSRTFDAAGARSRRGLARSTAPVEYGGLGTMSKSKNNGVDPQTLVEKYGADTARLFTMFAAPPEQSLEWSDEGVQGQFRFLRRLWKAVYEHTAEDSAAARSALRAAGAAFGGRARAAPHRAPGARQGRRSISAAGAPSTPRSPRSWNCSTPWATIPSAAIAAHAVRHEALELAVLMLSPIVPHICHNLWQALGHSRRRHRSSAGPEPDPQALAQATVELVVQVNGKLRGRFKLPVGRRA